MSTKGLIRYYGGWKGLIAPTNYTLWYVRWSDEDMNEERITGLSYWNARKVDTLQMAEYLKRKEGIYPIGLSKDYTLFE